MQINMQIVLSQGDIENAVRAYLRQEVPIAEGQDINVAFDFAGPEEVTVVAVVGKDSVLQPARQPQTATTGVRERGKPSPGRARRTQAEIAEDEAADKADAEVAAASQEAESAVNQAISEVDPAIRVQLGETVEGDEPPFDVDSTTTQTTAQADAITAPVTETKPTSSIFPNVTSSAPAITNDDPPPPPPAATSAKSLFANLGSPSVN